MSLRILRHCGRPAALAGLLLLAACAGGRLDPAAQTAAAPVAPPDPIADFAGQASPGATATVALQGGQAMPVRLVRSYQAASGRECREVLVGTGIGQRSELVCRGEGGWVAARPLLRGGTTR